MTLDERRDTEAEDRVTPRERIIVAGPILTRHGGLASIECPIGADRSLRVSVRGPKDLIDGIRPDVTAFLPMAVLIAGCEGKDVDCRAAVDAAYVFSLNANFAPLGAAIFGHHCVTVFEEFRTEPDALAPARQSRNGLLFSAGIDSFYSLAKMRQFGARPDYLIKM